MAQDSLQDGQIGPRWPPRWAKMASKSAQDGPRRPPRRSKRVQDTSKFAQEAPTTAQHDPRGLQEVPQEGP
eukprot:3877280-Pyramimonas_sp.AAC.1